MDVESQPLPSQQYVQFADMHPGPSTGTAASASAALACNLSTILTFSCRSTADQLARSLQLKLKNMANEREGTDTNNNASPTRSPTNSLPRTNGFSSRPPAQFSPTVSVSNTYLLVKDGCGEKVNGNAGDEEDDDDEDDFKERMKRSSSLKTGKTPPGTPGRKKIVRFADALGLDLEEVRSFLDEIPKVPKTAYKDLDCAIESLTAPRPLFNHMVPLRPLTSSVITSANATSACPAKTLVSTFHQPGSRPDFFDRVRDQKVLLENAFLSDNFTIKGTVRVLNMDFHKSVYLRYSLDEWKTCNEIQAAYVNGACDGFSDKFDFAIQLNPDKLEIGSKITFAARFHCQGQQFWDNNNGVNYEFHVTPTSSSSSASAAATSSQHPQNLFNYTHSTYSSMDDQWSTHMWI